MSSSPELVEHKPVTKLRLVQDGVQMSFQISIILMSNLDNHGCLIVFPDNSNIHQPLSK